MPMLLVVIKRAAIPSNDNNRNFGMPKPEGYRKAIRAMKLADKF